MGILNSNKQIDANRIECNGSLKVTLALTAAPDISANPVDIVLVLDRSGSMADIPLANMKEGAKTFIDIIDESTDSSQDGQIGGGSRIGIVSFSDTAVKDTQMITSVADLKAAVDGLTAGGSTNHADAFTKATELLEPPSGNQRVIVLFTDGKTTSGPPPAPVAAAARAAGIIIYCIGLIGADGIDVAVLNDWASDPDAAHVAVTPDAEDLEQLFEDLAANISKPGATNIVIDEEINPDFVITNFLPPAVGTVTSLNNTTLRWNIAQLGVTTTESAVLEFYIQHTAPTGGVKQVNESISYSDTEGNVVTFPDPSVLVDCGISVCAEDCPLPVDLTVEGCQDSLMVDMGDVYLQSLGRIVQLDVTVRKVCPGKRVALGVILTEVDDQGEEHSRGMKAITLPAHNAPSCRDILVKCVKFVLPEDLNVSGGDPSALCPPRNLRVRFIAHNIDTDYTCCCDTVTTVL